METVKFEFIIFELFSQVLLNMFTFLINTIHQEIQHILELPE